MNTTGMIFALCWAMAGFSALLSVTVAPWLMRRVQQRRGGQVAGLLWRVVACFLMGAAFPLVMLALSGLLIGALLALSGLLIGALLIFGGTVAVIIVAVVLIKVSSPKWGWLSVILLCNLIYAASCLTALNRVRELARRSSDGSNLSCIGKAMFLYHDDCGIYPDDLRRLVDAGWGSNFLVSASSDWPDELATTRPTGGRVILSTCNCPTTPRRIWYGSGNRPSIMATKEPMFSTRGERCDG